MVLAVLVVVAVVLVVLLVAVVLVVLLIAVVLVADWGGFEWSPVQTEGVVGSLRLFSGP